MCKQHLKVNWMVVSTGMMERCTTIDVRLPQQGRTQREEGLREELGVIQIRRYNNQSSCFLAGIEDLVHVRVRSD